ncbi:hypothetical protein EV385_1155 [Krasilnikovia cinnamomea]|uniref:Uncharacterized protein n=1 Tax=Krasilnikovia cinnamomea TaxID=349313 RepID=A0A4Q7ZGX8_9ACTN|nr:hypothetical protein [Krasilnikovia cinnamomea]RZU49405.1 hypothetical protein EV385_1155 [Krasilnikovia cinnamomea]
MKARSALDRFTRWCLARAARRWPAELRDEMHAEWLAELAALEADQATAKQRLGFAFSLLTAPPVRDASGAPRGWGESLAPGAPAVGLLVAALITLAVSDYAGNLASWLLDLAGAVPASFGADWLVALVAAVITLAWCLPAGRWLGRRWPLSRTGRFGDAGPAALAPVGFAPMVLLGALPDGDLPHLLGVLVGLLVWATGTAAVSVAAVRAAGRGRVALLMLLGVPAVSALAAAASAVPFALSSRDGQATMLASLTGTEPPPEFGEIVNGLTSRGFYYQGPWALALACFAAFTLAYGFGALRPRRATAPAPTTVAAPNAATRRGPFPLAVVVAGAGALAVAVIGWAYTLAVLTPGMLDVSQSAPMPGGDGELYMWTAELRATTILLATLGMLVATAERRFGPAGTLLVGAGLTLANAVLNRMNVSGPGGLRLALLVGVVPVIAGWVVAGRAPHGRQPDAALRRVTVGALVAVSVVPLITLQGTPGVNHPFLPVGLTVTTIGLAVAGMLLGIVPALALSRRPVPVWAAILLVVVPVALTVGAGLIPPPPSEDDTGVGAYAAFAALPLTVGCLALLRRHRARRPYRTAAVWTGLALAALPGTVLIIAGGGLLLNFVPNLVFAIDGGGYSFDGLSFVPGAATLMLPLAALAAARLDGSRGRAPSPDPDPLPAPESAQRSAPR